MYASLVQKLYAFEAIYAAFEKPYIVSEYIVFRQMSLCKYEYATEYGLSLVKNTFSTKGG